jgi:hypothetical protein
MTFALKLLVNQLESAKFKQTAQRHLEDFVASKPSETELEAGALLYASWCHEHSHHMPRGRS